MVASGVCFGACVPAQVVHVLKGPLPRADYSGKSCCELSWLLPGMLASHGAIGQTYASDQTEFISAPFILLCWNELLCLAKCVAYCQKCVCLWSLLRVPGVSGMLIAIALAPAFSLILCLCLLSSFRNQLACNPTHIDTDHKSVGMPSYQRPGPWYANAPSA